MNSGQTSHYHTLDWRPLGLALGVFFVITFILCICFDLIFPGQAMYQSWMRLLPGFKWLTLGGFIIGLIESFAYGFYIALVFCPLYNFFNGKFAGR